MPTRAHSPAELTTHTRVLQKIHPLSVTKLENNIQKMQITSIF